eukprot:5848368-Prymnesium_polylepis.3
MRRGGPGQGQPHRSRGVARAGRDANDDGAQVVVLVHALGEHDRVAARALLARHVRGHLAERRGHLQQAHGAGAWCMVHGAGPWEEWRCRGVGEGSRPGARVLCGVLRFARAYTPSHLQVHLAAAVAGRGRLDRPVVIEARVALLEEDFLARDDEQRADVLAEDLRSSRRVRANAAGVGAGRERRAHRRQRGTRTERSRPKDHIMSRHALHKSRARGRARVPGCC